MAACMEAGVAIVLATRHTPSTERNRSLAGRREGFAQEAAPERNGPPQNPPPVGVLGGSWQGGGSDAEGDPPRPPRSGQCRGACRTFLLEPPVHGVHTR